MRRHTPALLALFSALVLASCGGGASRARSTATITRSTRIETQRLIAPRTWRSEGRVCLVLSAGAHRALAHIGAVDTIIELRGGQPVDCIVGSSMGALVGALHASEPEVTVRSRYDHFIASYERQTRAEAESHGVLGAILGALFVAATGGAGLALVGGAAVGGLAGASGTSPVDIERFETVLNEEVSGVFIEQLERPAFASMYAQRDADRWTILSSRTGPLAHAVADSVANPFVFENLDIRSRPGLDAAADRVAAVPVEEACHIFPDAFLIVVNVTNEPAFYSSAMTCPMIEIRVDASMVTQDAMGGGAALDVAVDAGRTATLEALE